MLLFWVAALAQFLVFILLSISVACDEGGDKKIRFGRNCIILAIALTVTYFVPWDFTVSG